MRTTHKHLNVSARWLRRKIVELATYRVFVSRDGGPEVEFDRGHLTKAKLRLSPFDLVKTQEYGFYEAMELLYAWMAEANVLICADGTFHIRAYSKKGKDEN